MNAVELRIGNLISSYIFLAAQPVHFGPKEIRKVKVTADDIKYIAENPMATYNPILLTPEILGKCGFEWETERQQHLVLKVPEFGAFIFYFNEGELDTFMINQGNGIETIFLKGVNTLHRLQNIYFDIIETELAVHL